MPADAIASERIRALSGGGVPGIAVLVAGPEGVRAAGAAGLADVAGRVPASPGMVCPWFSMTKIVTATAAVRLAESGILDLDAPVFALVPALRRVRPAGWARRITAPHLLSHSAGLANPIPVRWVHPAGAPAPDPEVFLTGLLARHGRLRFEPGARASYSNLGPLVLADTVLHCGVHDLYDGQRMRPEKLEAWRSLRERYGNRDESQVDRGTLLAPAA